MEGGESMSITMKQARIGIGATQAEMAGKMGIHVQTYASLERNPNRVTIAQAIQFAEITGHSVMDIFFFN